MYKFYTRINLKDRIHRENCCETVPFLSVSMGEETVHLHFQVQEVNRRKLLTPFLTKTPLSLVRSEGTPKDIVT